MISSEEMNIYWKVKHELLLEDARYQMLYYLSVTNDCDEDDITDEELDKYDYDYLVRAFNDNEDCNVSFNDTWQSVIREYMYDYSDDEA